MSIVRAIDAVVACRICGTPGVGNCKCFVTLVCTKCPRILIVARTPEFFDYDRVETTCPRCDP